MGSPTRIPPTAEVYTAAQVMEKLQLSRSTVYDLAKSGDLPAIRIGKRIRFPKAAIDRLAEGKAA